MQASPKNVNLQIGTIQVIVIALKFPCLDFHQKRNSLKREEDGSRLYLCSMKILLKVINLRPCYVHNICRKILKRKKVRGDKSVRNILRESPITHPRVVCHVLHLWQEQQYPRWMWEQLLRLSCRPSLQLTSLPMKLWNKIFPFTKSIGQKKFPTK